MSNLKINSNCIMCGACLSFGYDFLEEKNDGTVCVKENTMLKPNSKELKTLMKNCPAKAFEYVIDVHVKSKEGQVGDLIKQLKNWKGLECPLKKDLNFVEKNYSMEMPFIGGSSYSYSSDRTAENAALTQFDNRVYSKMDMYILRVISQYRVDKLSPYYTYEKDTDSVYYKENQKIIELLKQIEKLSGKNISSDFSRFDVYPYDDIYYKMLNKGEFIGDELVGGVRSEFNSGSYSSLDSYRMYIDTSSVETYDGQGLFGRAKMKEKYCYYSLSEAISELEKDLRSALNYQADYIQQRAFEAVEWLVKEYNEAARKEIAKKIEICKRIMA